MGGRGGTGGGSSIGLYAWDASVAVAGGSIQSGDGGSGALGGLGGHGGVGSTGLGGRDGPLCPCIILQSLAEDGAGGGRVVEAPGVGGFNCPPTPGGQAGGAGGLGGSGTAGGQGGAGAGGDSFSVLKGGASVVTLSSTAMLRWGMAGGSLGNGALGTARGIGP